MGIGLGGDIFGYGGCVFRYGCFFLYVGVYDFDGIVGLIGCVDLCVWIGRDGYEVDFEWGLVFDDVLFDFVFCSGFDYFYLFDGIVD